MAQDNMTDIEIKKEEERLAELAKKDKRDEAEEKELQTLKDGKHTRFEKRIDKLTWEKKSAQERADQAEKEKEDLRARLDKLEEDSKKKAELPLEDEYIEIAGKKYLTDSSLIARINAKEITEQEAYTYQRKRDKEELRVSVIDEIKGEDQKKKNLDIRKNDAEWVLKNFPKFDKRHPEHNPEDPLYKEATRIYNNGYSANPKGLSESIKDAKRILRMTDEVIERSDDLGIESDDGAPERGGRNKEKEVTLSSDEEENAVRFYTLGSVVNPKTGRQYTRSEAISKALNAKKSRAGKE